MYLFVIILTELCGMLSQVPGQRRSPARGEAPEAVARPVSPDALVLLSADHGVV